PKAAVPAERAALEGQLDFLIEAGDAGGKGGQRRPVAAIQGYIEDLFGINRGANRGRAELHQRRRFRHSDDLSRLSDPHGEIELLLRPHRHRELRLHDSSESWLTSRAAVTAGLPIAGGSRAAVICHDDPPPC